MEEAQPDEMQASGARPDEARPAVDNPFARIARRYGWLPRPLRRRALSYAVGRAIPFVGTARLTVEALEAGHVAACLTPRRRVQNHVGGLHAGAMALLAETVSGLVVAVNVDAESTPVLRAMAVSFERPARGALRAAATLDEATATRIRTRPIGKVEVHVQMTDDAGAAPLTCRLDWAWLPRRRLPDLGN